MQLGEGLRTARSHILTFVSDLGSARSSTNTAWMAAEATYADDESVGLLRSGDSISRRSTPVYELSTSTRPS